MKDKDEPKRPAICSHQEAERPSTFQRADNTLPPSQDRRCPSRQRPPQRTPQLKPPAGGGGDDKNTLCLAAGCDITQGRWKPPQELQTLQASRLVRGRNLHFLPTVGGEVERGGWRVGGR